MKILMINKFLHRAGGAETYVFRLGEYLERQGHCVEYFGMDHPERIVGNQWNLYTEQMDFHSKGIFNKIKYPFRVIRSGEAYKKMRILLEQMKLDVVHINNFNYQLTPSILEAIRDYQNRNKHKIRVVFTAHDYQLLCPNHMQYIPAKKSVCEKCMGGKYGECIKNRCIHNSLFRSLLGAMEAWYWKYKKIYNLLDVIVCPSQFMQNKMEADQRFQGKTVCMLNFMDPLENIKNKKENYVLYFGRFSEEKGIDTLLEVCKKIPDIEFVFAGSGPIEDSLRGIPNVKNVGFQSGEALLKLIRNAKISVYPSSWYENCPFSVMESLKLGTPVIGARRGGIPELIRDGENGLLFAAGNEKELYEKIQMIYNDNCLYEKLLKGCEYTRFDTVADYAKKIMRMYGE